MPSYLETLLAPDEETDKPTSGYLDSLLQQPETGTDYLESITTNAAPSTSSAPSITKGGSWFNRFADVISRPFYALGNTISEALAGNWREIPQAFSEGWTGERPIAGRDIAVQLGASEEPILSWLAREAAESRPEGTAVWDPEAVDEFARTSKIPFAGTSPAGAVGFGIDVGADPLSYVGVGVLNRSGKALERLGTLTGSRSRQALEGSRDLITILGRGPSSLPGRAGEFARRGQAAVFRAGEQAGERALQVPLVRDTVAGLTTRGVGPVAVVRRRLDERQAEEQFLGRRAERQYGQMRRDIRQIEKEQQIPEGELGGAITEEAQRFPTASADVPEQVTGQVERPSLGGPEADEMVRSIRQRQPERLAEERAAGVRTPEFESDEILYLRREATPEFREWVRKNKKEGQERTPVLTLQHSAQTGRTVQHNATVAEINQAAIEGRTKQVWMNEAGEIVPEGTQGASEQVIITDEVQKNPYFPKYPIFEEDPAVIELARERMTIRSTTTARALDDIVETGIAEGWAVRTEDADVARQLAEQGYRLVDAPRFEGKLKGVYFPKEVADEIDRFYELFTNKDTRNAVLKAISGFNNWWKNQTLFAFPEYHVRNLGTGVVKNFYAGITPTNAAAYGRGNLFALYRQAAGMAPKSGRAASAADQLGTATITAKNGRKYTLEEIADLYESHRLSQGYFEVQFGGASGTAADTLRGRPFQLRRALLPTSDNYLVGAGRAAGTFIEDNLRGTLFVEKLREGYSPAKAAAFVRQYHYDYSDIPTWMKQAREYATPFITWAYKNLPNEIHTAVTQPGRYSRIVGAARSAEAGTEGPPPTAEEIPNFLLLPLYRGRDEEGNAVFGNIFNMWGALDVAELSSDALGYVVNQLSPLWSEPIEQQQNRDFYFQQPINPEELEAVRESWQQQNPTAGPLERISAWRTFQEPQGVFGLPSDVEHILSNYRPYTLLGRMFEPDLGNQLLRSLTSYTEYPSNPYFSTVAPFRNFDEGARYYQREIGYAMQDQAEAERRGDARAALLAQRRARQLEEAYRRYLNQMPSILGNQ